MVSADGLTPFRRVKGRKFDTPLSGFGERVWLRDPALERANKFNPRCTAARLFGFCLDSSRYIAVDFDWSFAGSGQSREPTLTTDGKSCHQETSTPAEFTCSEKTPRKLYLQQRDFMAHGTSDHCPVAEHWSVVAVHKATLRSVEFALKESSGKRTTRKPVFALQPVGWVMLPRGVR